MDELKSAQGFLNDGKVEDAIRCLQQIQSFGSKSSITKLMNIHEAIHKKLSSEVEDRQMQLIEVSATVAKLIRDVFIPSINIEDLRLGFAYIHELEWFGYYLSSHGYIIGRMCECIVPYATKAFQKCETQMAVLNRWDSVRASNALGHARFMKDIQKSSQQALNHATKVMNSVIVDHNDLELVKVINNIISFINDSKGKGEPITPSIEASSLPQINPQSGDPSIVIPAVEDYIKETLDIYHSGDYEKALNTMVNSIKENLKLSKQGVGALVSVFNSLYTNLCRRMQIESANMSVFVSFRVAESNRSNAERQIIDTVLELLNLLNDQLIPSANGDFLGYYLYLRGYFLHRLIESSRASAKASFSLAERILGKLSGTNTVKLRASLLHAHFMHRVFLSPQNALKIAEMGLNSATTEVPYTNKLMKDLFDLINLLKSSGEPAQMRDDMVLVAPDQRRNLEIEPDIGQGNSPATEAAASADDRVLAHILLDILSSEQPRQDVRPVVHQVYKRRNRKEK